MKPKRKLFIIVMVVALGGIYLVVKLTGILQSFTIPTGASEPAIKVGDRIWVSNLKSPKRYDHIVFTYHDSMSAQKEHRVFRLCGIPGDTVEIRNGDLYVNGQNTGGMFDLYLRYIIDVKDARAVNETLKLPEDDLIFGVDEVHAYLTNEHIEQLKKLKIAFNRKIVPKEENDVYIGRIHGQPWNIDNFGPLVIPRDHYFVLGDNRYRAMDSRFAGLVPVSDFYGTVISK